MAMKRMVLMALLGIVAFVSVTAGVLTEEQARRIAQDFRKSGARRLVQPTLVYTGVTEQKGARSVEAPAFYVYNYGEDQGFVIVSGEDTTLPILAFSDNGGFAVGEKMPVQVKSWLEGYCKYIQQVRSGSRGVTQAPVLGTDITIAVQPLLKSQWDQVEPYSNLCPPYDEVENCATGCAATAIAQIMRHHEWPETGEGSVVFDGQVVDFSQSRYDWANMLDTYEYGKDYPEAQSHAVAKLMYDVGVASEMQYGYESGTQNVYIYRSLYTYFKYSKGMQYLVRNSMTTAEWKRRIRKELDAGRPVYYGGFAEDMSMGHAFVCDGIDESNNYFHFNWGWSGHCNGYYFLNTLNPPVLGVGGGAGNFNADHVAIVGIQPAVEGEADSLTRSVLLMRKGFYTNTGQTTLGRDFNVQVRSLWNLGPEAINSQLAVGMYDNAGQFLDIVGDTVDLMMEAFYSKSLLIPISIPKETTEGEYELRLVYGDSESGWNEILYYSDCFRHAISLKVEENNVQLGSPAQSDIEFEAVLKQPLPEVLLPGKLYKGGIEFKNVGAWNFDGRIGYRLLQIPEVKDDPQFSETITDTLVVSQGDQYGFVYSEDSKTFKFEYRLTAPTHYLLQAYYVDPLSFDEVIAGEWPLVLEAPAEKFERRVVVELSGDQATDDCFAAIEKLTEQYPEQFIGITAATSMWGYSIPAYIDSLALPVGTVALVGRSQGFGVEKSTEIEQNFLTMREWPAFASLDAKANYVNEAKDSVAVTLGSRFAYEAEGLDMRFVLVTMDHARICGASNYCDVYMATGFYPSDAWSGVRGSIPAEVNVDEEYTYTFTVAIQSRWMDELQLVGLLIDGETGEICNAVRLEQVDIAPASGEVKPVSVALESTEATMNTGLCIELEAEVYPRSASQEIVWTSNNANVADFDQSGKLKTLAAGTAVLRATSALDETVYAEMQVTVQKADYTQTQQVKAGFLHHLVDFDSCPDKLVLSGELNGTDIALLRTLCGGDNVIGDEAITLLCPLCSLDISQCRIVEGGEPYYMDYLTENDVVGKEMFKWCLFLREIKLPNILAKIGDNAFFECGGGDLKTLEIPSSVQTIGYAPFYRCMGIDSFTVAAGSEAFKAVDGVLYNYAGTELVAYPSAKRDSIYVAVETLNRVLPYAFSGARFLTEFLGNLRLSNIGYGAFYNACKLETVSLSNRLNFVDEYAFAECVSLQSVRCERSTPAECADNAFNNVPEDCALVLPDGFDEEYHTASGWRRFANILTSVEEMQTEKTVRVCTVAGGLKITGVCDGEPIIVYTPAGMEVCRFVASGNEECISLSVPGIYIVRLAGFHTKVVVK